MPERVAASTLALWRSKTLSPLAFSTENRGALAKADSRQRGAACSTRQPCPAVDVQLLSEVARIAILVDKIPQGGAAHLDRRG